jgi:glutamate synthase domain-containing protein 1
MCGIVGLFLKNERLQPRLGALTARMLTVMSERGPDSAGFAIYGAGGTGVVKVTARLHVARDRGPAAPPASLSSVAAEMRRMGYLDVEPVLHDSHVVFRVPTPLLSAARAWLQEQHPLLEIVSVGSRMEIYKEIGLPDKVAARFELASMRGTHAIGHTRMATESSVTTQGAHPFSTGIDQCLVHNGSLSNHNAVRRKLQREGLRFETENDSEVAAGFLSWRLRSGASLKEALTDSLAELDGFYTFVAGTERGFAVLRDPISCKPAVMAEAEDYVAFGSEYRALADLPEIDSARVFEPDPATVYVWEHE